MKICKVRKGFCVTPSGYKLDNEGKPVVDQSFIHNPNLRINQVSASGNSLVPMTPTPSGPLTILPFVSKDASIAFQYFGSQGTRHQCSNNSLFLAFINRRPYNVIA